MITLSLSEAKMKLSGLVESVSRTDTEVMITKNGRPAAILVSPDEFESMQETISVQQDPYLMKGIRTGLRSLKAKRAKLYSLDELFKPGKS